MNATSTISCVVQDVLPEKDGLRVRWADNQTSFFPYRWLAEHAPEVRVSQDRQGREASILPPEIRPRFVHLHPNNVLEMGWDSFPRTTCFSTVWLREQVYEEERNVVPSLSHE